MRTQQILDKLLGFIQELTLFYGELSEELPDLRIVVDNTRNSELKKMVRKLFHFRGQRRFHNKITFQNRKTEIFTVF